MEQQSLDQPGTRSVRLTVTAGLLLLDVYIRPRLPAFCESHPHIVLGLRAHTSNAWRGTHGAQWRSGSRSVHG